MLVLGRQIGQKIKINDDITVIVLDITHTGVVKLGFDAPVHIVIDREEVSIKRKINPWQPK